MAVVPNSKYAGSLWANEHIVTFKTNATAIGMTAAQATTFETKANAVTAAITAQGIAQNAAKAATETADAAWADLANYASVCIAAIRAKADAAADPTAVYAAAQIPSPALPSPSGPPTEVSDLSATLQNDGSILCKWKGTVRGGQFFTVWRKLSTLPWAQIGSTASKTFTDNTLPVGSASATYMIRSHRGNQSSPGCEPVIIVFGSQSLPQAA
jgi:hypothetical protein